MTRRDHFRTTVRRMAGAPRRRSDRMKRVAEGGFEMKLPRRNFLHLAAGAAALPAVHRVGAGLSDAAGAGDRAVRARRHDRHRRATDGTMAFGAPRPAIRPIENRPGASTTIGTEVVV